MSRPCYHFLITCIAAYGHINAICGFGELLIRHGHKVTFAQRRKYKNLADTRGFQFIPFDENLIQSEFEDSVLKWMDENASKFREDSLTRYVGYTEEQKATIALGIDQYRKSNDALSAILANNSFDCIIHDGLDFLGCFFQTSIPVIVSNSLVPSLLYPNGPPAFSGLSINSDKALWTEFIKWFDDAHSKMSEQVNLMLKESGRPETFIMSKYTLPMPTIGFYHYPRDLDFLECGPRIPGWHRIDCYIRSPDEGTFNFPAKLKDKPGKLVYFSLGSLASSDLVLMRKALSALKRSPHRFIVSMGRRIDQLELADNMWGEEYVNQIKVLQTVDLVITHGGNNTVMESLYFGKPLIVIPYFYDQLDNAQRVVDKKIGFRVNPWQFDEDYLLECIDSALNDRELLARVESISQNMRNSDSDVKAIQLIENLISNTK